MLRYAVTVPKNTHQHSIYCQFRQTVVKGPRKGTELENYAVATNQILEPLPVKSILKHLMLFDINVV